MVQSLQLRAAVVALAMAGSSFLAISQVKETYDLGMLEADVEYTFPAMCEVKGTYIPKETGPVKILFSASPIGLYTSADHNENSFVNNGHAFTDLGQLTTYKQLQAGKEYYLYSSTNITGGTFIIREGKTEINVLSVTPTLDPESSDYRKSHFSVSDNYAIEVGFNYPVTVGNVILITEKGGRTAMAPNIFGTTMTVECANAIMDFYHNNLLEEGDKLTLRVLQIKDQLDPDVSYGGNGRLDLDFVAAAKPVEVTKITNGALGQEVLFDSYYMPGEPRAVIKLEFDGPLSTDINPVANLTYGNADNIDIGLYKEDVFGKNEGNVASFDFAGVLRRPIDMLPLSDPTTQPTSMFAGFSNIYSADGQRAYTGMRSNPTNFSMSLYLNVLQYTIAADFTPARGGNLSPGADMEIWVMNGAQIKFDGVQFDYVESGVPMTAVVEMSNIKSETDPYSDTDKIFTFKAPDINADPASEVKVSLKNLMVTDGLDHSADVQSEYKFQASGIGEVEAADEATTFDVYDITGVCVLHNATKDSLNSLAKGIYIANGKKIAVK